MSDKKQKKLLLQAIKNGEHNLVKRLVEQDNINYLTLIEDLSNSEYTVLAYVADLEMMHYFLDKGVKPNVYDLSIIAFDAKNNRSKIDILDYYLNHFFKNYKSEHKPSNYYDNFGHNYSVAQYLNPEQPLETMLFLKGINHINKNIYDYLKPKLNQFNIHQLIPFRYDIVDDKVDEDQYYILEMIVKKLSRKCVENEVFMQEINSEKNGKERLKEIDNENNDIRSWISFLLDEGLNPFIGSYNRNIYLDIDPFTRFILNREFDLIKKSIELFPEDWQAYQYIPSDKVYIESNRDLLKNILAYQGYDSNYYDRKKDPEIYLYSFKPEQRDEIILYLAKKGYPFYRSQLFKNALKTNYSYKFDYTEYKVDINTAIFWQILEEYTPQGDGTLIFFDTSFNENQNNILEKKGYALSKSEQLDQLIEKIAENRYISSDDLVGKAQKIIDSGVKLDNPMQILFKYFWLIEGREDHSKAIKLIIDNDLVSRAQFKTFFEQENSAYRTGGSFSGNEKIFQKYNDIKKPLFDKYKDIILTLDFELQKEYFLFNCDSIDEGCDFIKKNIDLSKKHLEWDIKYHKSWPLYRSFIQVHDEMGLLEPEAFNAYFLEDLLNRNAPKDILKWADNKVTEAIKINEIEKLNHLIYFELNNQLDLQKDNATVLNLTDKYEKTLLHQACNALSIEKINKLLNLGLKVNIYDRYSYTPLDSFLKAKPDVKESQHFATFKRLLKQLLREGGTPQDSIKLIKAKKYVEYRALLEDYSALEAELANEVDREKMQQEAYDNELIDVTIYRTEAVTHYKRYQVNTKIPRKELGLATDVLVKNYYYTPKESFDNDWESDTTDEFTIE